MAAPGAPGGAPPAYSFAAKQAPVEWRVVSDFHLDPFLSGRDVSPQDLNALDQVASMLEVARMISQSSGVLFVSVVCDASVLPLLRMDPWFGNLHPKRFH